MAVDDINDAIDANAVGPKRVQVGNQSVEQHSLKDQLAVRNDAAAREATTKPGFGLRFQKIRPYYE